MEKITKENLYAVVGSAGWKSYKKIPVTRMIRLSGPFTVKTREGEITCPDGFLAVDAHGWPYPIAADEHAAIYREAAPEQLFD